ncbi:hypothetical protein [Halothiobacillus sp.]|uniref:hypothetical protein n=1 Tax=Halothiobacillus sp. TaxID=1891311 RepID=UPI002AD4F108|nr:hypothetical protein [Halothiobacillus sp.]
MSNLNIIRTQAALTERARCKAIMDAGASAGQPKVAVQLMLGNCSPAEAVEVFKAVNGTSRFHKTLSDETPMRINESVWRANLQAALKQINKTI